MISLFEIDKFFLPVLINGDKQFKTGWRQWNMDTEQREQMSGESVLRHVLRHFGNLKKKNIIFSYKIIYRILLMQAI